MNKISEHAIKVLEYNALLALLAEYAKTDAGKFSALALKPSTDFTLIKKQIEETSEIYNLISLSEKLPLGKLEDITPLLLNQQIGGAELAPEELLSVAAVLQSAADVFNYAKANKELAPRLWSYAEKISPHPEIISEINRCIDPVDKIVKDSASAKLKELRQAKKRLQDSINKRLTSLINSADLKSAFENKTITTRNGRPVIALKSNFRNVIHGSLLDKSNSGFTSFVEPHIITESANELESARYEERKEIARILRELTKNIFEVKNKILENIDILTRIDLTNAKAQFSFDYKMSAPEINDARNLNLIKARHPLLMHFVKNNFSENSFLSIEEVKQKVVPLSIKSSEDLNLIIITGPNTGGKTVALKTIGLLALMAQTGMHIPAAKGTMLPVFNKIFADIGDEQSIEQSLSTFSSHLKNIARVIDNSDDKTLVLLDELGSGTDPAEGAALAEAILKFLHSAKAKVIATTHLGSLKTFAYSTPGAENASMEFNEKTLEPTYRLLVGQPGSSNALSIARRLGLNSELLDAAEEIISGKETDSAKLINKVQQLRVEAEKSIKRAARLKKKLRKEIAETKNEKEKVSDAANQKVEFILNDVKKIVDEFSSTAASAPTPWNERAAKLKDKVCEICAGTPLAQQREKFIEDLSEGQNVFVQPLNCYAQIKSITKGKKVVVVESDGVNFKVPFEKIFERPFSRPAVKKKVEKEKKPVKKVIKKRSPVNIKNFIKNLKVGDEVYSKTLKSVVKIEKINLEKQRLTVNFSGFPAELPFATIAKKRTDTDCTDFHG